MMPAAAPGTTTDLLIRVEPVADVVALGREWRDLEARSDPSFFQSWGWIGCWLRLLPPPMAPRLLRATASGRTVALGILVAATTVRHGFVISRGLNLNETGQRELDGLTIEYNGLLVDRDAGPDAEARCVVWLVGHGGADEIHLSAIRPSLHDAIGRRGLRCLIRDRKPVYAIDLVRLRATPGGLLARLGAGTRYRLRRSQRRYEALGRLVITAADRVDDALRVLADLEILHQRHWQARGQPGAFASRTFGRFHRALIEDRLAAGEIQLLRITAGDALIGCLYNFRHAGRIYCYQSGFDYRRDPALKPGLVCHALAICWNVERGEQAYDLLAGDNQFKRSFAETSGELLWLSVQRDRLVFRVEDWLRRFKSDLDVG